MRAAQRRDLFRAAEIEAPVLRTLCLQCGAESHTPKGRIQIRQNLYDRARSAQFSPGRNPLGDGAIGLAPSRYGDMMSKRISGSIFHLLAQRYNMRGFLLIAAA